MFDPPERVPYAKIPYSVKDSADHRELALEAARKSIVLLKNQGGLLPLKKTIKTLAVIGPDADNVEILLGNYNGEPTASGDAARRHSQQTRRADEGALCAGQRTRADDMPVMETVPARRCSLPTATDRQTGSRPSTSIPPHSMAGFTALRASRPATAVSECDAAVHPHRPGSQFPMVGRRAARRYG